MTLAMPDSIYPDHLPAGYPAYLGYVDGKWPTAHQLFVMFPQARILALTVTGDTDADGIDCEPQNPDAASSVQWASERMTSTFRPVIYASALGTPGYGMHDVLAELDARGIPRTAVRLLTAHYATRHICGPSSCGLLPIDADGTQWTDTFTGVNGAQIDMSELRDDFFTTTGDDPVGVTIPGVPGTWLTYTQYVDQVKGSLVTVGIGTNGHVYYTMKHGASDWTAPRALT